MFDDSDLVVLGVTGAVGEVGLALQGEVISQGGHRQTQQELEPGRAGEVGDRPLHGLVWRGLGAAGEFSDLYQD